MVPRVQAYIYRYMEYMEAQGCKKIYRTKNVIYNYKKRRISLTYLLWKEDQNYFFFNWEIKKIYEKYIKIR